MNLKALHKINYGLYIVGSKQGDKLNAQVANTVFQITAEPPTIAISINKQNLTHEFITASGVFAVSVLCQDTPLAFVGHFGFNSGRNMDKLEGINYGIGQTGAPIVIDNAVASLEAKVIQVVDVGTHTIFIGEVVAAEVIVEKECLTYAHYQQVKRGSTPRTAPSYVEEKKVELPKAPQYRCTVCGYVYDPERGDPEANIKPGIPFAQLPEDWLCPVCGAGKSEFEKIG